MGFNATLAAELAKGESEPLYVIKHQSTPLHASTSNWLYYSDGGAPTGAPSAANWKPFLVKFKPSRANTNPLTGKLTMSDVTFDLLATDDHVLVNLVGTEDPAGTDPLILFDDIAVYIGFRGLVWSTWERIFAGTITNIKLKSGGAIWTVTATSALTKARGQAMTNASKVDLLEGGDMDSWDDSPTEPFEWTKTQSVSTTVKEGTRPRGNHTEDGSSARFTFDGSGSLGKLEQAVTIATENVYTLEVWARGGAAAIPMEVAFENTDSTNWLSVPETSPGAATVSSTWSASETWLALTPGTNEFTRTLYRFKTEATGTNLTVYIRGVGAGAPPAGVASSLVFVDDVSLTKKVIVSGHPVDLALAILATPGDSPNLTWLAGEPTGAGLGVSVSESAPDDLFGTTFTDERDRYLADDTIDVTFDAPVDALSYLEEQFFRLWGSLYVGSKAMISFRGYHAPAPESSPVTIDTTNIVKVDGWQRRFDLMINSVIVKGDFNEGNDDKFTELAKVQDTAGITANGLKEVVIKSKWIQTPENGVLVATDTANRIFAQFKRAREEVKLTVQQSLLDINGIDTVALTDANLPDIVNRTRGLTDQNFEVLSVSPRGMRGTVSLVLLRSFYARPAFIAPNSHPDYDAPATDAEMQYAFIADNADDEMSNGDPPYTVQ